MKFLSVLVVFVAATVNAADPETPRAAIVAIPVTHDLRSDTATGEPLVVMFSRSDCGYCRRLEAEQFVPMLRSGDYAGRVVIRKLSLDRGQQIVDLDGNRVETQQIAARYRVTFTPTVLLLGPEGEELAERLVGLGLADFYGAYLERAIRRAKRHLGEQRSRARSVYLRPKPFECDNCNERREH